MVLSDFHVHTDFCDGRDTAEAVVESALSMGLTALGFSGHSPIDGQEDWCMTAEKALAYRNEIARLQKKYRDRISILCGVEQDLCSGRAPAVYDYSIGSVHLLNADGTPVSVDLSRADQKNIVKTHFDGDFYAFTEAYYASVAQVVERTNCSVIGHFDLITKFNEGNLLFDPQHPRYIKAWQAAADRLLLTNRPFEINTGAISRGYRTAPYPDTDILVYLRDRGARFLFSSDSHRADTLCYRFDGMQAMAEQLELNIIVRP